MNYIRDLFPAKKNKKNITNIGCLKCKIKLCLKARCINIQSKLLLISVISEIAFVETKFKLRQVIQKPRFYLNL